jgi:hypothetical protein
MNLRFPHSLEDEINAVQETRNSSENPNSETSQPPSYLEKYVQHILDKYNALYSAYPKITNYLSTALGTVGGDQIARQFSENPNIRLRDIAATALAAVGYSYLAPKMIDWGAQVTNALGEKIHTIKHNSTAHRITNTALVIAAYLPINLAYWNALSLKNTGMISFEDNLTGLCALLIGSIPYVIADYYAIKNLMQEHTVKYLRPFYSAVGLVWNTLFAGGNYLAQNIPRLPQ